MHWLQEVEACWNTYIRIPLRPTLGPDYWAAQKPQGEHGSARFQDLDEGSRILLDEVARHARRDGLIMDVGCNAGRHMRELRRRGFVGVYGIDVVAGDTAQVTFRGTFQDWLPRFRVGFFDVVYTHGATIELVSPTFPICREMARVARRAVVLLIAERGHAYPRLWEKEFAWAGWRLAKAIRPVTSDNPMSLLVFEPQGASR